MAQKALSYLISHPKFGNPETEKKLKDMIGLKFSHPFIESRSLSNIKILLNEFKSHGDYADFQEFESKIEDCDSVAESPSEGNLVLAICRKQLSTDFTGVTDSKISKPHLYLTQQASG